MIVQVYDEIAANKRKTVMLIGAFVVLIGALSYVAGIYFGDFTITIGALVGSLIYALVSYYSSSKAALAFNGAKEIQKSDDPRLWRIVENLAITNGMPMPKVYVMNDPALNAFATGRDPDHASVAITTGLLKALEDNELEGVMAHELGHVKNYDIRVSMIVFGLVAIISIMADIFLRVSIFGGRRNDKNSNGVMMVVGILAMVLAPLVAVLIQSAVSRKREFLADATGALTTRYPEGLASALEKIRDGGSTMKKQNTSTAHLFFANPLSTKSFTKAFSTHPPVNDRIAKLRGMDQ
ncbi:MAG: heat shock protein HtpX [Candidatus Saccharimonadales bacterium]